MYIYQVERELLQKAIMKRKDALHGRLLDAGSGRVSRYAHLFPAVTEVVRCDANENSSPDILCSVEAILEKDEVYDSILCTQVLGDVRDPRKAFAEFFRVLRSGGTLLVSEGFFAEIHSAPEDYWRFTPFCLQLLAKEAGFTDISAEIIGGFWTVRSQMSARLIINWFSLYKRPLIGKLFSACFKLHGKIAELLDHSMPKNVNNVFGHDVVLVAHKPH